MFCCACKICDLSSDDSLGTGVYKEKWLHYNKNNFKNKTILTAVPVSKRTHKEGVCAQFSFYKALKLL